MELPLPELLKYKLDDPRLDILQEYADYRSLSAAEAAQLVEGEKNSLDPGSAVNAFYASSDPFLLSLIRSKIGMPHFLGRLDLVRSVLKVNTSGNVFDVLDLGAGLGDSCIMGARLGHRATYADIPGVIMDFAAWRFQARGLEVERCRVDDLPPKRFDMIINFDVLEHLTDPVETIIQMLWHLKTGGVVFLTVDFFNFAEPFHLRKNMGYGFTVDRLLQALGLVPVWDGGVGPVRAVVTAAPRVYQLQAPVAEGLELARLAYRTARELIQEYAGYMAEELGRLGKIPESV
jgi:SAM-dependent methyltransferase